MSPLEAAARAAWNATRSPLSAGWIELTECGPGTFGAKTVEHHRRFLRAAIEALREPSDAMMEAAVLTHVRENGGIEHAPWLSWQAMIDALLKEGPTP